jgi:hypothetical protein
VFSNLPVVARFAKPAAAIQLDVKLSACGLGGFVARAARASSQWQV